MGALYQLDPIASRHVVNPQYLKCGFLATLGLSHMCGTVISNSDFSHFCWFIPGCH